MIGRQSNKTLSDGYPDKIAEESVPGNDKFTWDKIDNIIMIAPITKVEQLQTSDLLRDKLSSILAKMDSFSSV